MCVPPIDLKHFSITTGNDPEFAAELLGVFIADTEERLEHIQQALSGGNLAEIKKSAHHLRGSSANIGCFAMQAIAKDMELNNYTLSELQAMTAQLREILEQVRGYAETLTATGSGA